MKKLNLISPIIGEYFDDLIKDHSDRVSDIILVDCAKFSTISIKKEYIINNVELYHEFTVDNVNYLLLFFRNNEYYIATYNNSIKFLYRIEVVRKLKNRNTIQQKTIWRDKKDTSTKDIVEIFTTYMLKEVDIISDYRQMMSGNIMWKRLMHKYFDKYDVGYCSTENDKNRSIHYITNKNDIDKIVKDNLSNVGDFSKKHISYFISRKS